MSNVQMLPVSSLVESLRDVAGRHIDFYAPFKDIAPIVISTPGVDSAGEPNSGYSLGVSVEQQFRGELSSGALSQLCSKATTGSKAIVRRDYLDHLVGTQDVLGATLAKDNLDFWLERRHGERHNRGEKAEKRLYLRASAPEVVNDEDGKLAIGRAALAEMDLKVRAVLSDSYFAIDNLAVLTTVLQVLQGNYDFSGKVGDIDDQTAVAHNFAEGARIFKWRMSETHLDIMIFNPTMAFDLNDPDAGVQDLAEGTNQDGDHFWATPGGRSFKWGQNGITDNQDGAHLVMPACRITNSETGHGGFNVTFGLFEAICNNTCTLGNSVTRAHLGSLMDGSAKSAKSRDLRRKAIFCEVAESVRGVFDPTTFEVACKKFLNLWDVEIKADAINDAAAQICTLPGLTKSLLDDIVLAYAPKEQGRHTLGDLQRAVTNVATLDKIDSDTARALQNAGGKIVEAGRLVGAR